MSDRYPQRIVCLTEEPTEVLYALGEQQRIVGISGFTVRPAQARREKPKVSAFTSAKIGAISALRPDLVIGFSDIQADIARELISAGIEVWISNHRSVEGILNYIQRLGALVGNWLLRDQHHRRLRRICRSVRALGGFARIGGARGHADYDRHRDWRAGTADAHAFVTGAHWRLGLAGHRVGGERLNLGGAAET